MTERPPLTQESRVPHPTQSVGWASHVAAKLPPDGTWLLENTHPGKIHSALEDGDGRPSRWNTLRAMRVLNWYERSAV